ncbi:MAG: hypothetical protein MJA84_14010 [Firmicutes bacterium]|nr:hypothetical protein [Bacillota bacterium]
MLVADKHTHSAGGSDEAGAGGCPFRETVPGSRRGREFMLAYDSWVEFTASPETTPACAGRKE